MKIALRILLPLLILGGAFWLAWDYFNNPPEAKQRPTPVQVTQVEASRIKPSSYFVRLQTRGAVRPRTATTLIPEVNGRIIEIAPAFREGESFEKDDVLVKIDPVDYETAITIQESAVAEAARVLSEEQVRAAQALENWKRLGKTGEPSDLVLRKPQLAEAEARLKAAEAELAQRKIDLERTEIKAPYAGRILEKSVDVGQYISPGTQLARAFATDVMEVRLPLSNQQLAFVDLETEPAVSFTAELGLRIAEWNGKIVRVDSAIDQMSRQLFVVAQIDNPFRKNPIKIGQFLDAEIAGKELKNVFVLPRKSVRAGGEVILIDAENKILRQKVESIWEDRENVVIRAQGAGLKEGDIVCLTPLAFPANGAKVSPIIDGVAPPKEEIPTGKGKGKGGKGKGKSAAKGKGDDKT